MNHIRKERLYEVMDELIPGTQNLKIKYRDIHRNIWINDFTDKL